MQKDQQDWNDKCVVCDEGENRGVTLQGRITKGVGGLYRVSCKEGVFACASRGIFRIQDISPLVGDEVLIDSIDHEKKTGCICEILPRKNELTRPKVANVELAVITVAPAKPTVNLDLLDRLLIQTEQAHIAAIICMNKKDLEKSDVCNRVAKVYGDIGYPVVLTSAKEGEGISVLRNLMQGKVCVFAGPSGVGKSSVINAICPAFQLQTGAVSKKIQRGRHTTRHTELMPLDYETFVVDSPGFTSFALDGIEPHDLWQYYPEFKEGASRCYFNNCLHWTEPDCGVKAALGNHVDPGRYERYLVLLKDLLERNKEKYE